MKTHNAEMGRNGALAYMLFALTVITVFHNCDKCTAAVGGDTLSLGTSLTGNQTIISKNGTFEIGFFRPDGTDNWYIGIWYGKVAEKTIVWVANRDRPAKKRPGVFMLSKQGSLGLFDSENVSLWSANISNKASRAVILDSGNFLMVSDGSNSETVWQSFDYPVDTWLPGMRVGGKRELVCWKNSLDPATGIFSKRMDPSGISQFVLIWNNSVKYWESGVWDGESFIQIPEMTLNDLFNYRAENTTSGFYISYELRPPVNVLTRFVLQRSGVLQLYALFDNTNWSVVWSQPTDECSVYGICGAYGNCNSNNVDFCGCVEGFIPRDNRSWKMQDWSSSGCVRKSPLNCDTKNGSSDRFMGYNVTLPVNQAFTYPARSNEDCQKACLQNCSCNAFSFIGPSGTCQTWSGNLINMHTSPLESNSDVFIRLAASPISNSNNQSKLNLLNWKTRFQIALGTAREWLSGLPIIPKVDVHSYGKTLFEIISGRRNLDMSVQDSKKHYFPTWAAAQIYQGNTIDIVEEGVVLAEKADIEEARRAIVVALLCIEEDENVRPSMRQVLQMLEGKMELPTPHIPIDSDGDVVACNNPSEHELWSESMTEATTFSV
ncbi:hypothetical protein SUGI_0363280 [Cryptomeria japonica]|nr:hypothetical protein SUGI_0363280 [Cryptomeria japonica]